MIILYLFKVVLSRKDWLPFAIIVVVALSFSGSVETALTGFGTLIGVIVVFGLCGIAVLWGGMYTVYSPLVPAAESISSRKPGLQPPADPMEETYGAAPPWMRLLRWQGQGCREAGSSR
jgi:hypothetical protein